MSSPASLLALTHHGKFVKRSDAAITDVKSTTHYITFSAVQISRHTNKNGRLTFDVLMTAFCVNLTCKKENGWNVKRRQLSSHYSTMKRRRVKNLTRQGFASNIIITGFLQFTQERCGKQTLALALKLALLQP